VTARAVDGFAGATGAAASVEAVARGIAALGDGPVRMTERTGLRVGLTRGRLPDTVAASVAEAPDAVVIALGEIAGPAHERGADAALVAYRRHGVGLAHALHGRFAVVVHTPERVLLVGDHGGSRFPLYYRVDADGVRFGTAARAVAAMQGIPPGIDRQVLEDVLVLGHPVPGDTLFAGIEQVPAGCVIEIASGGAPSVHRSPLPSPYLPADEPATDHAADYTAALDAAIRVHVSENPAVLLSGGVDSAALVALLREAGCDPITTYTLDGGGTDTEDLEAAAEVAARFGTEHRVVRFDGTRLLADLAEVVWHAEQPLPHAHPHQQLFEAIRRDRDTVLGGYHNDAVWGLWPSHSAGPPAPDRRISAYLEVRRLLDRATVARLLPGAAATDDLLIERLDAAVPTHPDPRQDPILLQAVLFGGQLSDRDLGAVAALGNGVWVAEPYADPAISAVIQRMPMDARIRRRQDGSVEIKGFFKALVADRGLLPPGLVYRRKSWLRSATGDLLRGRAGDELEQLLLHDRAADRGLFDRDAVRALLAEHRAGRVDHSAPLTVLAGVELWFRAFTGAPAPTPVPSR